MTDSTQTSTKKANTGLLVLTEMYNCVKLIFPLILIFLFYIFPMNLLKPESSSSAPLATKCIPIIHIPSSLLLIEAVIIALAGTTSNHKTILSKILWCSSVSFMLFGFICLFCDFVGLIRTGNTEYDLMGAMCCLLMSCALATDTSEKLKNKQ